MFINYGALQTGSSACISQGTAGVCVYLKDLYLFIIYMVLDSLAIEQACRKAKQVCVCFCF
jgi:hypothetical protein